MARLQPQTVVQIANTLIKLKSDAKVQSTVKATEYIFKGLSRKANPLEPEEIKAYVANAKTKDGLRVSMRSVINNYSFHPHQTSGMY